MNRKETIQILAIVKAAYPNSKVEDANATVQSWLFGLGDFSADAVLKSVRFHIETSKFFPTVAEIRENIVRAELVYRESDIELKRIEQGNTKLLGDPKEEPDLESLCEFVGLGYENDTEKE